MHPGVHAAATPAKPALVLEPSGAVVTYARLDERSRRLAALFHQRGLRSGDVVAIWMDNDSPFAETAWAAQRSGLYHTAISTRLTPEEARFIIADCGAKALVTNDRLAPAAASIAGGVAGVPLLLVSGAVVEGFEAYDTALGTASPDDAPEPIEGREMLYSSGTTGRPKGVKPALRGLPLGAEGCDSLVPLVRGLYGFDTTTVLLSPAPLYHAAPLRFTLAATRLGATVVVPESFEPEQFLSLVERHRVTHVLAVPTMFVRLLKLPHAVRGGFDVSSLRCVIHGAAPCPVAVKRAMIEWLGPILHEYYSATEANGFCACNSEEWLAHPGTVGKPLMCTVHVLDDDGREVPTGETGTIWFDSGTKFEYHNDPDTTRAGRNDKGWTTLGDVGHVDEDGFVYLTDRRAYMVITGGVNVYPQEAEDLLLSHPAVADAAVFGVPDDDLGEAVKAVVQPVSIADAGPGLEQELIAWCRARLAAFKCPRSVDFEAELPRHPTGKLYKRLLRARYWPAPR